MSDKYAVWQFFPDEFHECVGRDLEAEEAVKLAHSYTTRPAAVAGFIRRIIIVDGGDNCAFEWKHGEGVTFPPRGADGRFVHTEE
jgi:hypothetical protein